MQALKGLVVGLGILIIVGFLLLIYGFYVKMTNPDFELLKSRDEAPAAAAAPTAAGAQPAGPVASQVPTGPLPGFGELRLALPEGCTVAGMEADGNRLYLRTGPEGLCERILIVDTTDGRLLGTLVLKP